MIRSQHPSAQWNLRAADEAVLNKVRKKTKKSPKKYFKKRNSSLKVTKLSFIFICLPQFLLLPGLRLSFLSLYLFRSVSVLYIGGIIMLFPAPPRTNQRTLSVKSSPLWAAWQFLFRCGGGGSFNCLMTVAFLHTFSDDSCILYRTLTL